MNYVENTGKPETSLAADMAIETEVYSRVSGYFRPVKQWNKGKREEFAERKFSFLNEVL